MLRSVGVLCRRPPARWHALSRPRASGGLAHHRLMSTEQIEALLCTKGGAAPLAERRRTAAELMKAAAPWTAAPHGEPEMSVEPGGSTPTQQWWTLSIPTSVEGDEPVIVSRVSVCHTGSNRGLAGGFPGGHLLLTRVSLALDRAFTRRRWSAVVRPPRRRPAWSRSCGCMRRSRWRYRSLSSARWSTTCASGAATRSPPSRRCQGCAGGSCEAKGGRRNLEPTAP